MNKSVFLTCCDIYAIQSYSSRINLKVRKKRALLKLPNGAKSWGVSNPHYSLIQGSYSQKKSGKKNNVKGRQEKS